MKHENFDRLNILNEIDRYQDIVMRAGKEMSEAVSRLRKLEVMVKDFSKEQKKDVEILQGVLYCKYKDQGGSEAYIKSKVASDEEYIELNKKHKIKTKILLDKYEEAVEKEITATTNYYLSRDRLKLIQSSVTLLLGDFYSLNEKKLVQDSENKKDSKLKLRKKMRMQEIGDDR